MWDRPQTGAAGREDSIYWDSSKSIYWDSSKNRYVGTVSQGFSPADRRIRRKATGRTKAEVRDKLRELHLPVDSGLRPRRRLTVDDALDNWLAHGLDGLSARTVALYKGTIAPALPQPGLRLHHRHATR